MPDGISDIIDVASSFESLAESHALGTCLEELRAPRSSNRLQELLRPDFRLSADQRRRNHHGLSLLYRAARAAKLGKAGRAAWLYAQAQEAVADEGEFAVLLESHRDLCFDVPVPAEPERRPKLGFAH